MKKKYIIATPDYTDKSGGIIMLHLLCHLLNENGGRAFIKRLPPPFWRKEKMIWFKLYIKYLIKTLFSIDLVKNDCFNTPTARKNDFEGAIVIYPEIVSANPFKAVNVVRWLLHKPGYHFNNVNYAEEDLIFFYREQFNVYGLDKKYLLDLTYYMDDVYFNRGIDNRTGSCYILRKGKHRKLEHDVSNSILIDNLSHTEISEIFSKVKYCISYDTYTMLSRYAAICGCISIVIPEKGVSKEEWVSDVKNRYGVAYGNEDISWALSTAHLTEKYFLEKRRMSHSKVKEFMQLTQKHFG